MGIQPSVVRGSVVGTGEGGQAGGVAERGGGCRGRLGWRTAVEDASVASE